jgi:hypothetical protein
MNKAPWLVLLTPLAGCVYATGSETVETSNFVIDVPVESVVFDLGAGDVRVEEGDVEFVQVERVMHYTCNPPNVVEAVTGTELLLGVECDCSWGCAVDYSLVVPPGTHLFGGTGSGDIELSGVAGDVELETGSGDVDASCLSGHVSLSTGSGDVDGACLTTVNVAVSTGSGDVDLELTEAPELVVIGTGSGDVDLAVPAGVYSVDVDTGSGDVDMDGLTLESGADSRIEVATGSGDVEITGR